MVSLNRQEIEEKILKEKKTLSKEQWLKLYEQALKLERTELENFKMTLAGRILAQVGGYYKAS